MEMKEAISIVKVIEDNFDKTHFPIEYEALVTLKSFCSLAENITGLPEKEILSPRCGIDPFHSGRVEGKNDMLDICRAAIAKKLSGNNILRIVHKTIHKKQVCSLELSKKLDVLLGNPPCSSVWSWCLHGDNTWHLELTENECLKSASGINAFTVAELGEMLKDKEEYTFFLWGYHLPKRDCFDLILETSDRVKRIWEVRAITEANARAKMLIYLLENKLISKEVLK